LPEPAAGVELDPEVSAGLDWLASASGDTTRFWERIDAAKLSYLRFTEAPQNFGRDPDLFDLGDDVVASVLAQAKSLLDSRRTYDVALASHCIPWVKQIAVNSGRLASIPGAPERARRMLANCTTAPDGPLFELVMAGNYASDGLDVEFVAEAPGLSKTPDLHLFVPGLVEPVAIELKRLRQGQYELEEHDLHQKIFKRASDVIFKRGLSLHIDVNYIKEIKEVSENYLEERLSRFLNSQLIVLGPYPWHDEFGSGEIRHANFAAVREDVRKSSLLVGTRMARLLSGGEVRVNRYNLAISGVPDKRDPRFVDEVHYASVVTWQCTAAKAIDKKARHVKSKLAEAERQIRSANIGIIHLAMDAEVGCESSDLRRERNKQVVQEFLSEAHIVALYVHYLVPRVSEASSWLVDETVDIFGAGLGSVPSTMVFPEASKVDNGLPAWKQFLPIFQSTQSTDGKQR
jgi:hypothetical protein